MEANASVVVPGRRLGKLPPKYDPRTLRLARYLKPLATLRAPLSCDYGKAWTDWGMLANDTHGDCACASFGHMIQCWDANTGKLPTLVTDLNVLALYSWVNGGQDNGAAMLDVLNRMRDSGMAGDKITAFAALEHASGKFLTLRRQALLRYSIYAFGGAYLGYNLPVTAQSQKVWDYAPNTPGNEAGSWGGHAVNAVAYDRTGYTIVTWGALQKVTWRFHARYCDESYAVLSPDWFNALGKTPPGLDLAALQADLVGL